MARLAEIPITDAVKMMTLVPARILRVDNRIGTIAPGMDADIVLFDENVNIRLVMGKGKVLVHTQWE
jgi:N-acetylglucosamine-6-phosphate deacetylase